ncbi:predicted protein [Chaetoceros tenuissimus]|uniref:Uncharacterized protein n=1 Tax=Chaetoceros tenuissimus TaxID=426638 RepID=A0AAD3CPG7_9STRA|nr:predicted protein [Chaetoceros tenuissimus]
MCGLQSLAVSTFQEYSSTPTDCSHQQVNFDVEDDPPSTLSPNQSSSSDDFQQVDFDEDTAPSALSPNQSLTSEDIQTSSDSSTKDTQDMVVEDNQTKAAEVAVSEVEISMSAELSDLTSTRIPRKPSKKEEEKADEREGKANRLYQQTMDTPQFVHYNMTEVERLEAAKTSTVCPELAEKFCKKYGKVGEDDLKYWEDMKVPGAVDMNVPGAVINVILSHFLSSTFKAGEYPNSGTRIEFLHPKVIQIVVDRYLEFGAIVGPLTYHGNWRPGDLVHVYDMAFSPLDGGISSISHMRDLYNGKKGVYRQACKNYLGMQDAPSVRMQIFDELQFLLPHTFNDSWKDFGKSLRPDHPLSVLVKKLVHISPLIRKDLVQAILSVMDEHCAKPVLIVNRVSEETKKKFTNYVSFLKILRPELPYVELYHPTWFAKSKIPWLVQWIKVTDATVEIIFHFCGEKYFIGEKEATKEEVREMLGDKGMEYIFKNGYNGLRIEPYTEDEREEIKNRKAGTAFVNGSTNLFQKGYIPWNKGKKMTVEEIAARKRTAAKNGNTIGGHNRGKKSTLEEKAAKKRKMEANGTKVGRPKGWRKSKKV